MNHDRRSLEECQQPFQRALAEPGPRPDEFRALAAIVTNASNRGQSAYVTTDANVPVDANHATAGEALAQRGPSPSSLQANDMSASRRRPGTQPLLYSTLPRCSLLRPARLRLRRH